MSHRYRQLVWDHSAQSDGTLLVALALAEHADADGIAWPSVRTLGKMARLSDRMVQKALRRLEAAGEIATVKAGTGAGHFSRYRITLAEKGELERVNSPETVNCDSPITAETVNQDAPIRPQRANHATPFARKRVNSGTQKGELGASERVNSAQSPTGVRTPVSGTPGTGLPEPGMNREPRARAAAAPNEATVRKANRVAEFVDAVRALGLDFDMDPLAAKAISKSGAAPGLLARAWVAAQRGEWQGEDTFLRRQPIRVVIERLNNFQTWEQQGRPTTDRRTNGHAPNGTTAPSSAEGKYAAAVRAAHVG